MAMGTIREMGRKAREASRAMATATPAAKTEFPSAHGPQEGDY